MTLELLNTTFEAAKTGLNLTESVPSTRVAVRPPCPRTFTPGLDPDESERLLEELVEFACRPPQVYEHRWTPGDVVVWDNRCLLHRARPWDMNQPRVMMHTRTAGDRPNELAAG